jgi:hypothetical protein
VAIKQTFLPRAGEQTQDFFIFFIQLYHQATAALPVNQTNHLTTNQLFDLSNPGYFYLFSLALPLTYCGSTSKSNLPFDNKSSI